MKICLTGTHFTPAQAVIEELRDEPKVEIVYIGRQVTREGDSSPSVESQILPKLGVKFIPLTSGRLQRSWTIYTIPSLFKIPIGFIQAFYLILKEKPDVVLSFGGYLAVPVVISAWVLSIPVIIHEQTLVSSLSNTIGSWFADKIAVSFKENISIAKKVVLTGNPLRREIVRISKKKINTDVNKIIGLSKKENLPLILITGGNQGSHTINQVASEILEDLTKIACIIHQTGDSKFQDFEKLTTKQKNLQNSERFLVKKWIEVDDLGIIFQNIDVAVSRAGINTLLELAYFGIPTLVVPFPYLYKNEQTVNARFFEKLGLVRVIYQKDLTSKNLLVNIKSILNDLHYFKEKAQEAKKVVISDAAKRLALETLLTKHDPRQTS